MEMGWVKGEGSRIEGCHLLSCILNGMVCLMNLTLWKIKSFTTSMIRLCVCVCVCVCV